MINIQIRDARASDRFYLDNELIDIYGKKIGAIGLAVYNVLARYANYNSQECYPSYKTIGDSLDLSRNAVIAAIKKLEDAGLIGIEKRISHEKGKPTTSSIYTLLAVEKTTPDKSYPGTLEVLASPLQGLSSTSKVPGVVPEKYHPGTSEGPELNVINETNLNNSSMPPARPAMPVKSKEPPTENKKIAQYFAKAISTHEDALSSMDYRDINRLVDEGFTLERVKPGIDETVNGIRSRPGGVVRTFKVCEKSIRQLDPTNQPVFIQTYQPQVKANPVLQADLDDMARWAAKRQQQRARWSNRQPQTQPATA